MYSLSAVFIEEKREEAKKSLLIFKLSFWSNCYADNLHYHSKVMTDKIKKNVSCSPRLHHFMKVTWHMTKYGDPYSEFVLCIYPIQSAHTHSSEHTHREHTVQWAAIYAAAPGEQLGVRCLAQGHLSRGIEGGESAVHSFPPPTIPAGPRLEPTTFGLRVQLSNH